MMKRFIASMLGSLAAIWISVILLFILMILLVAVVASKSLDSGSISSIEEKSVLYIDLSGSISERKTEPKLVEQLYDPGKTNIALNDLIAAITAAADDKRIEGIFIECGGVEGGLAQRCDILDALASFEESGKWIVAYSDGYSQGDYFIASIAGKVFVNPIGMVDIHGLSATTMYYKRLLDKLGVEMQVIKVGTYKSAVEPFILDHASEASRLQQEHFLGNIWDYFGSVIALNRDKTIETVNQWADDMILADSPEYYVENEIVDTLGYRYEALDFMKELTGTDLDDDLKLVSPDDYVRLADIPHRAKKGKRIAVLYAVGDIVDDGTDGIVGSKMVPLIEEITKDKKIDGLVMRVNSGGGSAFASEQIWEALERFKATGRPFYVSMSDYAASGGYYISSGADKIYAQPVTLTGSIGIFGMIPCAKGLLNDKIGVTTDNVSTNLNGDFPSVMTPMTPFQRAKMQQEINRGYETFVNRCAVGRNMPVDSIKAIAEGRVWDGVSALQLGLVDELGTLSDAISDMASTFGSDKYCIIEYPDPTATFWEMISEMQVKVRNTIIKNELGDTYDIYHNIRSVKELEPVQCRMEPLTIE